MNTSERDAALACLDCLIVYAVANDARRPCGVPGFLNAEFEQAFGVTMSTVRKRAAAVHRVEVL